MSFNLSKKLTTKHGTDNLHRVKELSLFGNSFQLAPECESCRRDQAMYMRMKAQILTPEPKAAEIYNALGYKHYPFVKKSVLPEKVDRKTEPPGTG